MGNAMLREKLLPAILIVLPATTGLAAQTTFEPTANECRTRPGSAAPPGSRWYYRISRIDHHRCWYLSSRRLEVRSRVHQGAALGRRHIVSRRTSVQMEPAESALALEQETLTAFAARWPDLPKFQDLDVSKVATTSYTEDPASHADQDLAVVEAKRAGQHQVPAGEAVFELAILGGALATALLVAGGVFHVTRRTYSRDRQYPPADQPDRRGDLLTGFAEAANTNGLAADLETSLHKLTRDLQLVAGRRVARRSFSPRPRTAVVSQPAGAIDHMHSSRG